MQPEIIILCTYRILDGLSTIIDGPNTLTCQSTNTKVAPRDPPSHSSVTSGGTFHPILYHIFHHHQLFVFCRVRIMVGYPFKDLNKLNESP